LVIAADVRRASVPRSGDDASRRRPHELSRHLVHRISSAGNALNPAGPLWRWQYGNHYRRGIGRFPMVVAIYPTWQQTREPL